MSEQNTGIYDAWNKALSRVQGQWILFLGADDLLADKDVLKNVSHILKQLPEIILYAGGELVLLDHTGKGFHRVLTKHEYVVESFGKGMPVPHPALFHRSTIFKKHSFDITYKIAGDYEFLTRTWKFNSQGYSLPLHVTNMYNTGISNDLRNKKTLFYENCRILKTHFNTYTLLAYILSPVLVPLKAALKKRLLSTSIGCLLLKKINELKQ